MKTEITYNLNEFEDKSEVLKIIQHKLIEFYESPMDVDFSITIEGYIGKYKDYKKEEK